jgi:hypothetical protein
MEALVTKIHQGVGAALAKIGPQSKQKRSLSQSWITQMVRMRFAIGDSAFFLGEALQGVDFRKLAVLLTALDPLTVIISRANEDRLHSYEDTECFMSQNQYVVRAPYTGLVGVAAKLLLDDTNWGVGKIIFSANWAYFIVTGKLMARQDYLDVGKEIKKDLEKEVELQKIPELFQSYMESPSPTRLNIMDHDFLNLVVAGEQSHTHAHTHTHYQSHTHTHTHTRRKKCKRRHAVVHARAHGHRHAARSRPQRWQQAPGTARTPSPGAHGGSVPHRFSDEPHRSPWHWHQDVHIEASRSAGGRGAPTA